jgi:hypothetical protein
VDARALVAGPTDLAVLSEAKKDPTTNLPGLIERTSPPTSSTIPTYSWPIGAGTVNGLDAAIRHRPDPVIEEPTDAIIRLSATCSCGSDLGAYITAPRMWPPSRVRIR